jgi:hypothetical protein
MNSNEWSIVKCKKTAYKPPQKREAPQPSFDELYPNTLNSSVKKAVVTPTVTYSKKLLEGISPDLKPIAKPEVLMHVATKGLRNRIVVKDLVWPDDDFDYSKVVFPPCSDLTKALQKKQDDLAKKSSRFGLLYEDELDEYEPPYEATEDYEEDDWQNEEDDQEFNAELYN